MILSRWRNARAARSAKNVASLPVDVNRSGHHRPNVHALVDVPWSRQGRYLELVPIHCERFDPSFIDGGLAGRVDTLRRIEVIDGAGRSTLRCARMIYRFVPEPDCSWGSYFRHSDAIT